MRDLTPLLLSGLVLFVPLIVVGMLSVSRQSETNRQREASHCGNPMFKPASHDPIRSQATVHQPLTTALRSFLIRIDVRLHLQVIEQIEIRVQVFVFVEGLEVANGRARLNPR